MGHVLAFYCKVRFLTRILFLQGELSIVFHQYTFLSASRFYNFLSLVFSLLTTFSHITILFFFFTNLYLLLAALIIDSSFFRIVHSNLNLLFWFTFSRGVADTQRISSIWPMQIIVGSYCKQRHYEVQGAYIKPQMGF